MFNFVNNKMRNGEIDILRFIFITLIITHHLIHQNILQNQVGYFGFFAVEFFYILSGLLLARHYYVVRNSINYDEIPNEVVRYTIRKISYVFAYYLFIQIIYVIILLVEGKTVIQLCKDIIESIPLYLFINVPIHKYCSMYLNGNWYLSALYVSTFIIYAFLLLKGENFTKIYAPIICIIIYGYIYYKYKSPVPCIASDIVSGGLLRALADMLLGVIGYELVILLNNINFNKKAILLIKYMCFFILICYCLFSHSYQYYFSMTILALVGISLSFTKSVYLISANIITNICGKLSLVMFLSHGIVINILHYNTIIIHFKLLPLLLLIVIVFSLAIIFIVDNIIVRLFFYIKK